MKALHSLILLLCTSFSLFAAEAEDVLNYWFGNECASSENLKKWFQGGEEVDSDIRSLFYETHQDAIFGRLNHWKQTPRGRLALIILLDQFSRNLYRNSPEAFMGDSLALSLSLEGIEKGDDLQVTPVERSFFYLPIEHAEDRQLQKLSIEKFTQLAENAPAELSQLCANFLDYAYRHQVIIDRFGRYPHRNHALLRTTSPEEKEFLKKEGSSF
ncbi:MAG: hypothetical protein S4CHLAM45_02640 [Chlamydiales bacterium]|nr:hypothetical protein [Chlamydiales bacterium]MCH9619122.1 hypothetical protein [Chlamydiales bacterium]MCH9622384.1 hypothetical protein [Chlamydiales bacterium]